MRRLNCLNIPPAQSPVAMHLRPELTHPFDVSVEEAQEIQRCLSRLLSDEPPALVERVGAAYAAFLPREAVRVVAAAVVMQLPELSAIDQAVTQAVTAFPYRPGFLAFSVGPALTEALEHLAVEPDVVLFAAHGRAHPRGLGLAAHLGVLLDVPTIGCAEELLRGGEALAVPLVAQPYPRPLFVSPGHRMDADTAIAVVRGCSRDHRWPEPIRAARMLAREAARSQR